MTNIFNFNFPIFSLKILAVAITKPFPLHTNIIGIFFIEPTSILPYKGGSCNPQKHHFYPLKNKSAYDNINQI